jgi:cobalt-zinc-cadmium resistance protein CzcA
MITTRSQSLEIRNQLFQATADIGIYSRKLKILLNISALPVPSDTGLHRIEFPLVKDSAAAGENPSLGYFQQQAEISRIENKLERSLMMPDLNVGYFSQTIIGTQDVNGTPRSFGNDFRFSGIQAGISVPLWFVPFTSRAKAAKINENIARSDAENYARTVSGNYLSLLDEYRKFSSAVDYYEKQAIPETDLIIDQATRSYKAGALDFLDFVHTLNSTVAMRQSYLDALNNCNQTIISIEYITGKIF